MTQKLGWIAAALVAAAVGLAASCSGSQSGNLSLSATTNASAGSDGGSVSGLDLGNGIILTEARLLVRRIVLDRCEVGAARCEECSECSGCTGESCEQCDRCDDCEEAGDDVKAGPALVDLKGADLAGGIHAVFDASVPPGDYSEVKLVIAQASEKMVTEHAELAGMKALHASIVIDGTIDGKPFEFVTPMHVQQERCGPFTVGKGTSALTLTVDPRGWFTGDKGERLDPSQPLDRGEILENLRRSLRLKAPGDRDDDEHGECVCAPATDGGIPDGGATDGGSTDGGSTDGSNAGL
jgi:hypothetical protein